MLSWAKSQQESEAALGRAALMLGMQVQRGDELLKDEDSALGPPIPGWEVQMIASPRLSHVEVKLNDLMNSVAELIPNAEPRYLASWLLEDLEYGSESDSAAGLLLRDRTGAGLNEADDYALSLPQAWLLLNRLGRELATYHDQFVAPSSYTGVHSIDVMRAADITTDPCRFTDTDKPYVDVSARLQREFFSGVLRYLKEVQGVEAAGTLKSGVSMANKVMGLADALMSWVAIQGTLDVSEPITRTSSSDSTGSDSVLTFSLAMKFPFGPAGLGCLKNAFSAAGLQVPNIPASQPAAGVPLEWQGLQGFPLKERQSWYVQFMGTQYGTTAKTDAQGLATRGIQGHRGGCFGDGPTFTRSALVKVWYPPQKPWTKAYEIGLGLNTFTLAIRSLTSIKSLNVSLRVPVIDQKDHCPHEEESGGGGPCIDYRDCSGLATKP
ncbi:hypothetical protein GCM10009858_44910 [Terrabacter carboxydivorans]|uniref:Uncharacterized protein n=2 Tax=Terrabacter carboxydivorans TaxID=619730 RepID=A0ABP5ZNF3_9MICO